MKLNWGTYIVFAFVAFAGFIGTLVVKTFGHKVDLVSNTYYEDELKYQQKIDRIKNAQNETEKVTWQWQGNALVFSFPENATGTIYFMRTSDSDLDKKNTILLDRNKQQSIDTKMMKSGLYLMKLEWVVGEKSYYMEQNVTI